MGQAAGGIGAPKAQPKPQSKAKPKQKLIKIASKSTEIPLDEITNIRAENQPTYSAHP
jgi:hypothetical protein